MCTIVAIDITSAIDVIINASDRILSHKYVAAPGRVIKNYHKIIHDAMY